MLYVAYGIYSDTERTDNDYQVILCYDISHWDKWAQTLCPTDLHHSGPSKPRQLYFAHTGNTSWGIQNLACDPTTQCLLAAVYPGKKPEWPNYGLFALDMQRKAERTILEGVEPRTRGQVLPFSQHGQHDAAKALWGWHFPYGSTGLCPIGGGYYYISHNNRDKVTGLESTVLHLYRWSGTPEAPFSLVE